MAEQLKLELIKFHMRSGVYRDTHLKVLSESLEKIITVGQVAELKMIDSATDTKQWLGTWDRIEVVYLSKYKMLNPLSWFKRWDRSFWLIAPEVIYGLEEGFRINVIFPGEVILEDDGEVKIYYDTSDAVECLATAKVEDLIALCEPV